ncbi:efflux RND transporter periplasmic adaptor subunit [Methylotenera sp.]|uniref:efflux RND transporter periplasmic adaptor subunit n=1 Tax=Methylotenera sp. TaxID=2051956 RepID=UPI002720FA9E|nr:efflux RND transporter periplasmic adaptor subunit [Methylotenera sp.]MDO9205330.1 efflux RND transporter periplasmic adaptor subunit [Methylotenera sp.]MDP1523388.1 efflux RND transporter periplasmic adaptor subunit [Methylotenera sp.]MDP2231000.1 efflux RND transporter periplasmic adaptor subunit [Methylotenera sp.]MDP3141854.1 efflux RND transporter periplasmic adaptor subunit [Methylotenera sp.]MDP3818604.1 efflux RND transporter periplasmic adaptor subunit [Methylotenera sp.]
MNKLIKKAIIAFIFLGVVAGAYYYYTKHNTIQPDQLYRLQEITQGDVAQSVSANGTLNPVTLISVGTQVSGRVSKLYVDFNDHVEKGQILLELDDALFASQIAQSQGNVRNVQASVELAQANEARMRTLYAQEYVSKQELDHSVQALKSARAQLDTAHGQLLRDQTNQSYSVIRSPVSGVVVDRVVDVGQTVAASFQTPTLIKIAQDLSKMQIDSSFAEADIGNIKVGQKAKFSVDAFPNRNFEGVVKQLRLNPTVTSNVVTYNVVVSVDNPEQVLLPGMTAYVNIMVAKHENVLLAPNAALRFKPKLDDNSADKTTSNRGQNSGRKKSGKEDTSSGKLYVIQNGKLTPLRINVGISDGKFTEISSAELKVNDKVIVGENQTNDAISSSTSTMRFRMF